MRSYSIKVMVRGQLKQSVISAKDDTHARAAAARQGQIIEVKQLRSGSRWDQMSLADRLVFFQRLSSMLSSKVGTSEALGIIQSSFSGTVRDAARILRDRLEAGEQLHEAMAAAGPRYFPETVVAIVKTGSRGGDLVYALREASRFEKELDQVKRESSKGIGSALMGFIAGVITIVSSTYYVAPMIMESSLVKAAKDGVDVGWVLTMANVITVIALVTSALVGGLLFYGVVLRQLSPAAVDRGIQKIPFYRDMALARTNYMVFFGLAVLLKAGLRVEEALRLTIDSAPRGELRNDLNRALVSIVKGSVEPWPYKMTMLHPTDKAALATAQDRTQIASTIETLAIQYQSLYRQRLAQFVPMMQGFAAIFLSLAGFVLFGVSVVPLMQVTSSIMKML